MLPNYFGDFSASKPEWVADDVNNGTIGHLCLHGFTLADFGEMEKDTDIAVVKMIRQANQRYIRLGIAMCYSV